MARTCRVSSNGGLTPVGPGGFGEVEDHRTIAEVNLFDLGDAPDSYATTFGANGPHHNLGGPQLGRRALAPGLADSEYEPDASAFRRTQTTTCRGSGTLCALCPLWFPFGLSKHRGRTRTSPLGGFYRSPLGGIT
jgi:hypothetical protein